ncbi:MAG: 3-hydroxyacyl-ACP dehydratase FabZ [bacterium]
MEEKIMEIYDIKNRIPHRFPMLLVDRIIEIERGKRAVGVKCVTINEGFFEGHFPEEPIMPGVLIIESMSQVAGILLSEENERGRKNEGKENENEERRMYLGMVDHIKFRKPVIPGDRMLIEVNVIKTFVNMAKVKGEVKVDNEIVAEGELDFVVVKRKGR